MSGSRQFTFGKSFHLTETFLVILIYFTSGDIWLKLYSIILYDVEQYGCNSLDWAGPCAARFCCHWTGILISWTGGTLVDGVKPSTPFPHALSLSPSLSPLSLSLPLLSLPLLSYFESRLSGLVFCKTTPIRWSKRHSRCEVQWAGGRQDAVFVHTVALCCQRSFLTSSCFFLFFPFFPSLFLTISLDKWPWPGSAQLRPITGRLPMVRACVRCFAQSVSAFRWKRSVASGFNTRWLILEVFS